MKMPPAPNPTQVNALARAGTDRWPPTSVAIVLSATIVIHGAPKESARITSTIAATFQDDFDSIDCTMFVPTV
jgi:hypothetical protein